MEKIRYKRSLAILLSAGLVVFLGREVYVAIAVPQKVKEQLNQYAIPLKTIDPDDDLADLEPIGRAIGDARIVGLGEATHGTSDFFTMKHRLIRYLVERKGFTVVAFEGSWPRVEVIDEYVKTGKGSAGDSVKSLFLGLRTHEVTNLLQWMRDYNRTASQKISFAGFDSQSDEDGIHRVLNYVCQYTPKEFLWFYQQYAERLKPFKFSAFDEKNPEVFWRQVQSYFYMQLPHSDSVVQRLDRSKEEFVQVSQLREFKLARHAAVRAVQGAKMAAFGYEGTLAIRDQTMTDNVKWLVEVAYPGQKIILWAHNGHVGYHSFPFANRKSFNGRSTYDMMGAHLMRIFEEKYYVVGFGFNHGEFTGGVEKFLPSKPNLGFYPIPQPPSNTGEAVLGEGPQPYYFLDFRSLPQQLSLSKWLKEPHKYYYIGGEGIDPKRTSESFMSEFRLKQAYDGYFYVHRAHASRPLEEVMFKLEGTKAPMHWKACKP